MTNGLTRCCCRRGLARTRRSPGPTLSGSFCVRGRSPRRAARATDAAETLGAAEGRLARQVLVDEAHRHRALPYRRGDALDRAGAAVADGEDAGQARLQRHRRATALDRVDVEVGDVEVAAG